MNPANRIYLGVVGASLLASISLWEGTKYVPYRDVNNVLTVCEGITGGIQENKTYTRAECDALVSKAAAFHGKGIVECINVPISKNEYEAYTLFAYNVGVANACSSAAITELNKGNHALACKRLATNSKGEPAWSYSGGKYYQGLQNRRQYESNLCLR